MQWHFVSQIEKIFSKGKFGKQGIWRAICEKSSAALRLFWLVEAPAPIPKHAEFLCGYAPSRCLC